MSNRQIYKVEVEYECSKVIIVQCHAASYNSFSIDEDSLFDTVRKKYEVCSRCMAPVKRILLLPEQQIEMFVCEVKEICRI